MKKDKSREIPKKNYLYAIIISLLTVIALLYFVRWYNLRNKEMTPTSIIADTIMEVNFSEIDNYLLENPYIMLYINDSTNLENEEFEKEFIKYIKKYEFSNKIIYIDIAKLSDNDKKELTEKWLINKEIFTPNILLIENGVTKDQLYYSQTSINIEDVKNFLARYEVNS